jgi:glutamate synthase domain-containing protein 3
MLRPQVFAFSDGDVQVGVIASEKQAIDAILHSLSEDDRRICPVADRYWNARGGSHTDGGSFRFDLQADEAGRMRMTCMDKFGKTVPMPRQSEACDFTNEVDESLSVDAETTEDLRKALEAKDALRIYDILSSRTATWSYEQIRRVFRFISDQAENTRYTATIIEALTWVNDRRFATGTKKRSHILHIVRTELDRLFRNLPRFGAESEDTEYRVIEFADRDRLRAPQGDETCLVIDVKNFTPEGDTCAAHTAMDGYMLGWKHFICFGCLGQRFDGVGMGPETDGVTVDVYGSSGDYLASGIDGMTVTVHGNAQDQVAQIIKRGQLVVHGDVGQTFMYGAKGGHVYILGNAAGRPLINSVGRPRVVINGTCLDFLGESFMAGDPHNNGGFVVLNGITFDDDGRVVPLAEPYPGSNLFSLASGGAIFIRDPHESVVEQQLNGGEFVRLTDKDWELILPHLQENERLFGIAIEELLTVNGEERLPGEVYRKVVPVQNKALSNKVEYEVEDDDAVNVPILEG